jgi:hypothetical protein
VVICNLYIKNLNLGQLERVALFLWKAKDFFVASKYKRLNKMFEMGKKKNNKMGT